MTVLCVCRVRFIRSEIGFAEGWGAFTDMELMYFVGIDIGSTAAKVAVLGAKELHFVLPTGWSSPDTAKEIECRLKQQGIALEQASIVATGYGRRAVEYADYEVTEITCHAAGCAAEHPDCTIIDVGGQDTKAIHLAGGRVDDFLMNDKCSAGTGKFIEVMANRLECDIDALFALAERGTVLPISSLCTVFAESEIIGYIGNGRSRADIAAGIVDSVAEKVVQLVQHMDIDKEVLLTGGLSHLSFFADCLGRKLKHTVVPVPEGRYAGAYGAAHLAGKKAAEASL